MHFFKSFLCRIVILSILVLYATSLSLAFASGSDPLNFASGPDAKLNKRYFTKERGNPFKEMNFEYFRGNITYDSEHNEACLVIDGKKMSMRDLERIIMTHEGFQIEVRITEE